MQGNIHEVFNLMGICEYVNTLVLFYVNESVLFLIKCLIPISLNKDILLNQFIFFIITAC